MKCLTVEEVNEFNPTCDNPMDVESIKGRLKLKIVTKVIGDSISYVSPAGRLYTVSIHNFLDGIKSLKQQKTKVVKMQKVLFKSSDGEFEVIDLNVDYVEDENLGKIVKVLGQVYEIEYEDEE